MYLQQGTKMSIQLTIISLDFDSDEKPRTEIYEKEIINIGRLDTNDVVLSGNDVADYHAQIRIDNNNGNFKLYLTDLGTGLGTRLENIVIQPHTEVTFEFNKRISIGSYLIKPMEAKGDVSVEDSAIRKTFYAPRSTPSRVVIRDENLKTSLAEETTKPTEQTVVAPVTAKVEPKKEEPRTPEPKVVPKSFAYPKKEHKVSIALKGEDITGLDFEAAELFTISGSLTNKGKGIANYKIDCGEAGSTQTDSSGQFKIEGILDGTAFKLNLNDPAYKFSVATREGSIERDLQLNITASKIFSLTGKVIHKNQPMSGVTVNAGPIGSTTSGIDGSFKFNDIEEDTKYEIIAAKAKFVFDKPSISGIVNSNLDNLVFNANQLLSISGRVMHKGKPMEGVEIDGGDIGKTVTDSEGYYCFTDVPDGTEYSLSAKKGKYVFGTKTGVTGS